MKGIKTSKKVTIIIGAGPAGLTAAFELLAKTDIKPIIYEMSKDIGGISKTLNYKGNRIDIGGHRFFSKSDKVMKWWLNTLPLQGAPARDDLILGRKTSVSSDKNAPDPERQDRVLLIRNRISRIFFLRKFFDYPISINLAAVRNLGLVTVLKIALSYMKARLFPIREEKSLEDFFINRFGKTLHLLFFKDYTEKVWGVPCDLIKPEWGVQRVKGLSVMKAIFHAFKTAISRDRNISQKDTETSLIETFLYPKFGPGQMWETVALHIQRMGGEIYLNSKAIKFVLGGDLITEVEIENLNTGQHFVRKGDYFVSTMPVRDLILSMEGNVPNEVERLARGLVYRDFITVGLLLQKLKIKNETKIGTFNKLIPDNWIYIQERDVKLGRLQIFNNWSPYMVNDPNTVWIGLEYFCNEGDSLWNMNDNEFSSFAIDELSKIDVIEKKDVLDYVVIRMPKTYPAYFGTYNKFSLIREFTDKIKNLFLIGRNGMHRYNNMDHSMLAAMEAVENIAREIETKDNIWAVNSEEQYLEDRKNL